MANKSLPARGVPDKKNRKPVQPDFKAPRPSRAFLAKAAKKRSTPKKRASDEKNEKNLKLVQSIFETALPLPAFLAKAEKKQLTPKERALLVDQAILVLEGFYVHLPMKRAMYAVDPLQRLRLLRHRLSTIASDLDFHAEMIDIFASLHDVHTGYMLPKPFGTAMAVLPFRVESCFVARKRKYFVSSIIPGFDHGTFKRGVEVLSWNGVPIARAVAAAGTGSGGSNTEARHAKGLARLTTRALVRMSPPDEEWVRVGYRDHASRLDEARFDWKVMEKSKYINIEPSTMSLEVDLVRQVRTILFARKLDDPDDKQLSGVFARKTITTPRGKVGYIRIFTFNVEPGKFVAKFKKLLKGLPKNGLIIDVRDNGGGHTAAGERLLQFLGKVRPIEPERLYLINTPLMLRLCKLQKTNRREFGPQGLKPWLRSLEQSVETGAQFSASFPYTDPKVCNKSKPLYDGPLVVITNALSYSTTEFFAAGVQDHRLGLILGTDKCTGGGGANVKTHKVLWQSFFDDPDHSPFRIPPGGSGFTFAFRRSQRVGAQAGNEVEDFGVKPDVFHAMTQKDILGSNEDLIHCAAEVLADMRDGPRSGQRRARASKKAAAKRKGRA